MQSLSWETLQRGWNQMAAKAPDWPHQKALLYWKRSLLKRPFYLPDDCPSLAPKMRSPTTVITREKIVPNGSTNKVRIVTSTCDHTQTTVRLQKCGPFFLAPSASPVAVFCSIQLDQQGSSVIEPCNWVGGPVVFYHPNPLQKLLWRYREGKKSHHFEWMDGKMEYKCDQSIK